MKKLLLYFQQHQIQLPYLIQVVVLVIIIIIGSLLFYQGMVLIKLEKSKVIIILQKY